MTNKHEGKDEETCPVCGARGVPIVYGLPDTELFEAGERGEVVIGGCIITGQDPTHACRNGHAWK